MNFTRFNSPTVEPLLTVIIKHTCSFHYLNFFELLFSKTLFHEAVYLYGPLTESTKTFTKRFHCIIKWFLKDTLPCITSLQNILAVTNVGFIVHICLHLPQIFYLHMYFLHTPMIFDLGLESLQTVSHHESYYCWYNCNCTYLIRQINSLYVWNRCCYLDLFCTASFLAASCNNCVSTSSAGNCTYRTTDPLIKQFFTDSMWGYLSGSVTLISVSFMLRNWSTECNVPHILKSFFNSTTTSFPTKDLKNE